MDCTLSRKALPDVAVDGDAELVARRHHAGVLAFFGRQLQPARGDGARYVVRFHLRHMGSELFEGSANVARDACLDRFLQRGLALTHDLVHDRRLHARLLQLGEGLPRIHGVELLFVAHQHDPRNAQGVGDPEQVAGLDGGGERALVHHQHRLREGVAHVAGALARQPALGNACVACKETL